MYTKFNNIVIPIIIEKVIEDLYNYKHENVENS